MSRTATFQEVTATGGKYLWSSATNWDTDTKPVDDDLVVIPANKSCLMDVDTSAWTGLRTVTITSHTTTPGKLYFMNGYSGYLKIRTGYNLVGTNAATNGRLLVNSDGVWRGIKGTTVTGSATNNTLTAASHGLVDTTIVSFFPATTAAVLPAPLQVGKNYYVVTDETDTFQVSLTSGGAAIDLTTDGTGTFGVNTCLVFTNKAVIDLGATSKIDAQYLDIALCCYQPATTQYLRTYGVRHTVTGSAAADTLTKVSHGLTNTTPVMIMSTGGTVPAPLALDTVYYVVNQAADTFKLAPYSGGTAIDLTTNGDGTLEVYTGAANLANPVSVFEDVTAETGWTNAAGHNRVVLANAGPVDSDQQRLTITTLDTNHIHLSAALDSLQYPGARIYLMSRNVSIRSACVTNIDICDYTNATSAAGVFQCEMWSSAGTGTTFYGDGVYSGTAHVLSGTISGYNYGVYSGTAHVLSGTISGCYAGVNSGTAHVLSGTVSGCYYGTYDGTAHVISGTISGCTYGVYYGSAHVLSGTISGCSYGVNTGTAHVVSGTISGCYYGTYDGTACVISGTISGCNDGVAYGTAHVLSGTISGCNYGVYVGTAHVVSGTISGCNYGVYFGTAYVISGTISGCNVGVNYGSACVISGTLSGCTYGVYDVIALTGYGETWTNVTTPVTQTFATVGPLSLIRSFTHNGTANDLRAWSMGGAITHDTDSIFVAESGKTYSHKFTHTNASYYSYMEWELDVASVAALSIPCYAQHAAGLTAAQRLTFQIIDKSADPWSAAAHTPVDEWVTADSASVQTHTLTYSRVDDRPLLLRVFALRGSGNSWLLFDAPLDPASTQPIVIPDGETVTMRVRAEYL